MRASVWLLRLAGLSALVNGAGFGAFDVPAMWHLHRDGEIWFALGNPTYGHGRFEAHGIDVNVAVQAAFLGTCLVLVVGGVMLLLARPAGVVVTLGGMVLCAPFWWGFDLPFAWISAGQVAVLLLMAAGVRRIAAPAST